MAGREKPQQPELTEGREPGDESEQEHQEAEAPPRAPKAETSVAVVKQEPAGVVEAVGKLPANLEAALRFRAIDRKMAADVASRSWGKELDLETRKAVGQYLAKWNIDVTEIDVLGGNLYRNARFYLSRLARIMEQGLVEYAYADHIANDPRLTTLAKSEDAETARLAKREFERRMQERLTHAVPEDARVAVVFRVKLKSVGREITGCKWILENPVNDPVGKAKPVETCESRAARRCMRQVIPNLSPVDVEHYQALEADMMALSKQTAVAIEGVQDDEGNWTAIAGGPRVRGGSGPDTKPVGDPIDSYGK